METAIECAEAVRRGEVSARELVERALAAIERAKGELNAFVHVDAALARREAERVDARVARGEDPGPLAGVPFGVKDMDRCAGLPVSYGSLLRKGEPPAEADSVHVGRLRAAGAVPVGVTAAPEFGTVQFTRSRAWGTTRSPWDPARSPGGSSGGSASAVAAGLVPLATAGDGGGSTRIPAAWTGLVGLKPSFGRIPREGATTSQTAVWGALTPSVRDAARHLDVAAGPDDRDRTSLPPPSLPEGSGGSYEAAAERLEVAGLRAAWSPDLGYAAVDPEVRSICERAAGVLADAARLTLVDRKVELTEPVKAWLGTGAIDIWLHLQRGEWPARADELVPGTRRSFEMTQELPLPWYAGVLERRTRLEAEAAELFADVDLLLTPATAVPALPAEGPGRRVEIDGKSVEPAMTVPFTMLANLCWNPAVSIPAGTTRAGLPVGLQVTARRHHDAWCLRLARILEEAQPWPRRAPGYEAAVARPAAAGGTG